MGECGADDRQLADGLAAVREGRWRELTDWPGSYLLVAERGAETVVAGDLTSQHPVYWRGGAGGVRWSTSAMALAAIDGAGVDVGVLAEWMALGPPGVRADRSLFHGVRRVPPGHVLRADPDGVRTERYEPVEYPAVSLAEAAPGVGAALRLSVGVRLGGRAVSADLAGLDSTTLACLAAERGPVVATTFTSGTLRNDDLAYARRTAAAVEGLDHRVVEAGDAAGHYAGLEERAFPVTDAPSPYVVTAGMKRAALAEASMGRPGPGVHFCGVGGDVVLSGSGYLPDLLRERALGAAWVHAQERARVGRTSVWRVLRRAAPAARGGLAGSLRGAAAGLREPVRAWDPDARPPLGWVAVLATAGWMTAEVRKGLAEVLEEVAEGGVEETPQRLAAWVDRQDLVGLGASTEGLRSIAESEFGTELAAPYLDNGVVRACLSVAAQDRRPPGTFKPMLGAAFPDGPVPPFVLQRMTKGVFDGMAFAGVRRNAGVLRGLLGPDSRLAGLGLVEPGPVAGALRRASAGQRAPHGSLSLAVSVEAWLRMVDVRRVAWWEEVEGHVAAA